MRISIDNDCSLRNYTNDRLKNQKHLKIDGNERLASCTSQNEFTWFEQVDLLLVNDYSVSSERMNL